MRKQAGLRIAQLAATFRAWHVVSPQRPLVTLERVAAAAFLEPATGTKRWSSCIPCLRRRTCAHHAPRL
jgi:hypothetical protein